MPGKYPFVFFKLHRSLWAQAKIILTKIVRGYFLLTELLQNHRRHYGPISYQPLYAPRPTFIQFVRSCRGTATPSVIPNQCSLHRCRLVNHAPLSSGGNATCWVLCCYFLRITNTLSYFKQTSNQLDFHAHTMELKLPLDECKKKHHTCWFDLIDCVISEIVEKKQGRSQIKNGTKKCRTKRKSEFLFILLIISIWNEVRMRKRLLDWSKERNWVMLQLIFRCLMIFREKNKLKSGSKRALYV